MEGKVTVYISVSGTPRPALSIPRFECATYSLYPLKWLRFVGYTIYGAEGNLSHTHDGEPISYDTTDIEARSYYFISPDPPRLIDATGIDGRTSMDSVATARRRNFRARVLERDGTCVITNQAPGKCEASHIIPHSKTDDYMSNFVSIRAGPNNDLQLESIDDPRNGLLLHYIIHKSLGDGDVAFLRTPNFAMGVADVEGPENIPDIPRLTLQNIGCQDVLLRQWLLCRTSDARHPADVNTWPPPLILDFFYGCAALKAWGPKRFKKFIKDLNWHDYYKSPKAKSGEEGDKGSEEGNISQQVLDRRAQYKEPQKRDGAKENRRMTKMSLVK